MNSRRRILFCVLFGANVLVRGDVSVRYSASSTAEDSSPAAARDGDRFDPTPAHAWRGAASATRWWWQADFGRSTEVGAIFQVVGDHDFVLTNAPACRVWQVSDDGEHWRDLTETRVTDERRLYRIHRLREVVTTRWLRLQVEAVHGSTPVLREVEFYAETNSIVPFPAWILAVNMTHDSRLPGHGQEFIPLARSARTNLAAQQIWLTDFTPELVAVEPRPLAAFLSGTFKDWCQVDRNHWRGTERVLQAGQLPLWASCGGAQGLAILAENGADQPWDCPHCRDPKAPRIPIYTHIGHLKAETAPACGVYDDCVFERGPHGVRQLVADPVFAGLPDDFMVMESHCGQIGWAPAGWELIATAGPGTLTKTQCLRLKNRPIYAAQFHIEMAGTPEVSRVIMRNFLRLATDWKAGL